MGEVPETRYRADVPDSSDGPVDCDVDIRLLGPVELHVNGTKVPLRSARARNLMTALALNANSVVPVDRIVAFIWDDPPETARQQIHNVVSALRATFAKSRTSTIVTETLGYRLEIPDLAVDLAGFQADVREADAVEGDPVFAVRLLDKALKRWRGPALVDVVARTSESIAVALNAQYLDVAEKLAELRLGLGDHVPVLADLGPLVAEHPYRERLRALLMTALHASGRQAEALSVFEQGRRILVRELGVDPGPILRSAHQTVLSGAVEAPSTLVSAPSPAPSPPVRIPGERQTQSMAACLPRDIAEFTGRAAQIDRLIAEALKGGSIAPTLLVIYGMGGVGKTTLSIHLARRLADRYPDGQFFLDLQGFSARNEPLNALQGLTSLLREAGTPPESLPSNLAQCVSTWRAKLAGKRTLVLLDNAANAEQLRPLLPAEPGTLVIISSRVRMTELEGIEPLWLDVMSADEALTLFSSIVGSERVAAEREASTEIVELCGRLPLAIHIAGARLRTRTSWSISFAVQQLRSRRGRARLLAIGERSVVGVLAWSYRHLDAAQQRFFRLMSVHPGPGIDAHAAAALAGLSHEEAEARLDELLEVNLIEQRTPTFYQFHDLVRDCSRALFDEYTDADERRCAVQRLAEYYLQSARRWCEEVTKGFFTISTSNAIRVEMKTPESDEEAYKLYELEYHNLVAVQRVATDYGLLDYAWQLTCYLLPYFGLRNYTGEASQMLDSALASAKAVGSRRGESICLTGLASLRRRRDQLNDAEALLRRALELSRQLDDKDSETRQLSLLGLVFEEQSRLDEAHSTYTLAEALAKEAGDVQAQASILCHLGNLSLELGRFDEALQQLRQSCDMDDGYGMHEIRMAALVNIGYCYLLTGSLDKAGQNFAESRALSQKAKNHLHEVYALVGLSSIARAVGAHVESLQKGREALEIARNLEKNDLVILALGAIGDVHLDCGRHEEAEQVYREALWLATASGSSRSTAQAHEGLAHLCSACGDTDSAGEHWRRALEPGYGAVYHYAEAQAHLASPGVGGAHCWRCRASAGTVPPPAQRPVGRPKVVRS